MMTIIPKFFPRSSNDKDADVERELIRRESEIGGQLFGPVPAGHTRQFFCLDERTWIWHEQWLDQNKQRQSMTTKYIVRPSAGIIRSQNGQAYQTLTRTELENFYRATQLYDKKIQSYYSQLLQTA